MYHWWEQPYVRLPKFLGYRISKPDDGMMMTRIKEIRFKREKWCCPPIYDERTSEIEKLTYVRGVPGTEQFGLFWFFPAWRCLECKVAFIVSRLEDLHHECTEPL